MRRRTLLRRVATGAAVCTLAGCLERRRLDGDPRSARSATTTSSTTATPRAVDGTPETPTSSPASGLPRRASLGDVDDGHLRSTLDIAAEVTVTEPLVTDAHTAQVRVTLENDADRDRTLNYTAAECDLNLLRGSQVDGDGRLLLAPGGTDWTPAEANCWRARHRNVSCGIPAPTHGVDLPAGEAVTWRFDLWATSGGPCMPPGRYEFERSFDDGAAGLSLTLRLTDPDS